MSTAWRQWLWLWSINMMTWLSFTRLKELESRTGTRGSEGEEVKQERNCLSPVLFYSYSTGTDIKTIVKHMIWHSYNCLQGDYCQDAAAAHDWRVKSTSQASSVNCLTCQREPQNEICEVTPRSSAALTSRLSSLLSLQQHWLRPQPKRLVSQ